MAQFPKGWFIWNPDLEDMSAQGVCAINSTPKPLQQLLKQTNKHTQFWNLDALPFATWVFHHFRCSSLSQPSLHRR